MKISNKIKISTLAVMLWGIIPFAVSAAEVEISIYKDLTLGKVSVIGAAEKDDVVTLQILPENITPEEIEEKPELSANTVYYRNEIVGENGKAEFSFYLEEGSYMLYAATSKGGEYHKEPLVFASEETYAKIIRELKNENKDEFVEKTGTYKRILGFDLENYSERAVKRFYDEYKNSLSESDYEENLKNFKKCVLVEEVNGNNSIPVASYAKEIYKDDSELLEFINKYINNDETTDTFADKLKSASNKNIKNTQILEEYVKQALVLTVVKYPIEDFNIKDVFFAYSDILGLDEVTEYASVYRKLSGKDYDTSDELVSAYTDALNSGSSSGSSSGGGGGSSSGNKKNPSNVTSAPIQFPSSAGQMANVDIFDDLGSVLWAKESIEGLYKKEIINGKEAHKFYPLDNVLREEFVKMLVLTFNLKLTGQEMPFSDVAQNAWFYDYVRIAYDAEIINGISSDMFGTGQNITRQDICVMIYRALEKCGVEIPKINEAFKFNDEVLIADYAKEAVASLNMAGIINGNDIGNFNPQNPASRAETAKILYGVLKLIGRG